MLVTSAALFIAVSLTVFGISYYYFTTRHRERMILIEKGLPSDYLKDSHNYLHLVLTLGIVCIGVSAGIGLGAVIRSLNIEGVNGLAFPIAIFLCLGISLVISYFILNRLQNKK